jgi:DNA-binding transcriptional LysR family regulator
VQFGLVVNPLPHPDLVLHVLFHDATVLSVAEPAPRGGRREHDERLLRERPMVLVEELPQSQEVLRRLAARKLYPGRRVGCGTLEVVRSLTAAGVGVGLMPARVAAHGAPAALRRLHPDLPSVADTIYLAHRSDLHRTRAARRLKEALVAHGRRLAEAPPA